MMVVAAVVLAFGLGVAKTARAAGGGGAPSTPTAGFVPPSNLWMIASSKALKSYALSRVAQAVSYGGSDGIILPGGKTWAQVYTNHADIRVIQNLLGKEELSFMIVDPEVNQYFYGQQMDDGGYGLFWGMTQYKLVKGKYGWDVPAEAKNVNADIVSYQIPIYLPGLEWAYAVVNANGYQQYVNMQVHDNRLLFSTSLAGLADVGWDGKMVLYGQGNSAAYDMGSGENIPGTPINAAVQMAVKGLIMVDDPDQIASNPKSQDGKGENPVYQVSMSSAKKVTLSGKTTEGELATGVYVRKVGASAPTYYSITPGTGVVVPLDAGIYHIWFEYPMFDADNPSIPPWWWGDGGLGQSGRVIRMARMS